jgi:hypothetical protein
VVDVQAWFRYSCTSITGGAIVTTIVIVFNLKLKALEDVTTWKRSMPM